MVVLYLLPPEVDRDTPTDNGFLAELNRLCNEVVSTLRAGNAEEREALATLLEQVMTENLPLEGVQDFLQVLVVWLRGQETQPLAEKLPAPLRDAYTQMVAAVKQEKMENSNEDNNSALTVADLPLVVSSIILQGTAEQRQQLGTDLIRVQQQLPGDQAPLGLFLGCLVAALQGETTDVTQLVPPFTELWQEFQERLHVSSDESN